MAKNCTGTSDCDEFGLVGLTISRDLNSQRVAINSIVAGSDTFDGVPQGGTIQLYIDVPGDAFFSPTCYQATVYAFMTPNSNQLGSISNICDLAEFDGYFQCGAISLGLSDIGNTVPWTLTLPDGYLNSDIGNIQIIVHSTYVGESIDGSIVTEKKICYPEHEMECTPLVIYVNNSDPVIVGSSVRVNDVAPTLSLPTDNINTTPYPLIPTTGLITIDWQISDAENDEALAFGVKLIRTSDGSTVYSTVTNPTTGNVTKIGGLAGTTRSHTISFAGLDPDVSYHVLIECYSKSNSYFPIFPNQSGLTQPWLFTKAPSTFKYFLKTMADSSNELPVIASTLFGSQDVDTYSIGNPLRLNIESPYEFTINATDVESDSLSYRLKIFEWDKDPQILSNVIYDSGYQSSNTFSVALTNEDSTKTYTVLSYIKEDAVNTDVVPVIKLGAVKFTYPDPEVDSLSLDDGSVTTSLPGLISDAQLHVSNAVFNIVSDITKGTPTSKFRIDLFYGVELNAFWSRTFDLIGAGSETRTVEYRSVDAVVSGIRYYRIPANTQVRVEVTVTNIVNGNDVESESLMGWFTYSLGDLSLYSVNEQSVETAITGGTISHKLALKLRENGGFNRTLVDFFTGFNDIRIEWRIKKPAAEAPPLDGEFRILKNVPITDENADIINLTTNPLANDFFHTYDTGRIAEWIVYEGLADSASDPSSVEIDRGSTVISNSFPPGPINSLVAAFFATESNSGSAQVRLEFEYLDADENTPAFIDIYLQDANESPNTLPIYHNRITWDNLTELSGNRYSYVIPEVFTVPINAIYNVGVSISDGQSLDPNSSFESDIDLSGPLYQVIAGEAVLVPFSDGVPTSPSKYVSFQTTQATFQYSSPNIVDLKIEGSLCNDTEDCNDAVGNTCNLLNARPTFTWTYSDENTPSQAQASFFIEIAVDSSFATLVVSQQVNSSIASFQPVSDLPSRINLFVRITVTNAVGRQSAPTYCFFKINGSRPNYEITSVPSGTSHVSTFFAKNKLATNVYADPMPNSTITWTQDGVVIKTGSTNDPDNFFVTDFSAQDSGTTIAFEVEDPEYGDLESSNSILLTNARVANSITTTGLAFTPSVPTVSRMPAKSPSMKAEWSLNDPDGDVQYAFRLKFYSLGHESNPVFDTGYIYYARPGDIDGDGVVSQSDLNNIASRIGQNYGDPDYLETCDLNRDGKITAADVTAATLFLGHVYPTSGEINYVIRFPLNLPEGSVIYYKFEVSDGEKITPSLADFPENPGRIFVANTYGPISINNRPVASNLRISGMAVGANCFVTKSSPVISWNYFDADGDSQGLYELIVSSNSDLNEVNSFLWSISFGGTTTSVVYSGLPLTNDTPYYVFLRVHDGIEFSNRVAGVFTKIADVYRIFPSEPYHTNKIEARAQSASQPPYMEGEHRIDWYVNDVLVKSGSTSNLANLAINTKFPSDYNLDAEDTGSVVYFKIDETFNSNQVTILNHRPTISYVTATPIIPGAKPRVSRNPIINWEFVDADNDSQLFFELDIGTTSGGSDVYSSGPIFKNPGDVNGDLVVDQSDVVIVTDLLGVTSSDANYNINADCNRDGIIDQLDLDIVNAAIGQIYDGNLNIKSHQIPVTLDQGTTYFYTLYVCDGEKTDPTLPSIPDPVWSGQRIEIIASGSFVTNAKPEVRDVLINGLNTSESQNDKTPTFSWTYVDDEGHVESYFRFRLYSDANLTNLLWDTGNIASSGNSITYNFNNTGPTLQYSSTYYYSIVVSDGIDESDVKSGSVSVIKTGPVLKICTVNDRINPLNVRGLVPVFAWDIEEEEDDSPIVAFEIRVGTSSESLGTDSFTGDIWNTGPILDPNPFRATWNFNGTCFAGCNPGDQLEPSTNYYYQVQVTNQLGQTSNWCYGLFRLNNIPSAIDLQVLPLAPATGDDLEGFYRFVDDAGEKESSLTEIKWYLTRNDVLAEIPELRNTKFVPNSYTLNGDIWYFTVKPHDGTEYGDIVRSPMVQVENKPPSATALDISPAEPTAASELTASWLASDPDGDDISVTIEWFKNGVIQSSLRNSNIVPAGYLKTGDVWYFVVQPFDGTEYGLFSKSNEVTILNTKPEVLSMTVDGSILPTEVKTRSPNIAWRFYDADQEVQEAYRLVIGTKPIKTSGRLSDLTPPQFGFRENGILYSFPDGEVITGNEVFDTGEVTSAESSYSYKSGDPLEPVVLTVVNISRISNYAVDTDLATLVLVPARTNGEVVFNFTGKSGTYEIGLEYTQESKKSKFRIAVDGVQLDEFTSEKGVGTKIKKLIPMRLESNSKITITGIALEAGAKAKFKRFICVPSTKLELLPTSMDLSGYVLQDDKSIKLSALSGTAAVAFPFPSGSYDLELHYVTELSGNPTLTLDVGNSTIINFTFESGVQSRVRMVSNIAITTGTIVKITATKNGGASGRIVKIVAKPRQQAVNGYILRPGTPYYASVKVFDGAAWSDWYTTKFFIDGSTWKDNVSNASGWTIESRFRLIQ